MLQARAASYLPGGKFQSLKRDRGGSCLAASGSGVVQGTCFNPSNGIGVVHAKIALLRNLRRKSFNPSNGIGVVHARDECDDVVEGGEVSIPQTG